MNYLLQGPITQYPNDKFGEYIFNHLSNQNPSKIVAINSETGETITSADLQTCIIRTTLALKPYVQQEDVVALICENEIASIFPLVASFYLGTAITLLNQSYTIGEITNNFNQSKPGVIFCSENSTKTVLEIQQNVDFIKLVVVLAKDTEENVLTIYDFMDTVDNTSIANFRPVEIKDENQTAVILSSSGTSGPPKGVMITYKNWIAAIPYLTEKHFMGISCESIPLLLIPIFHSFGTVALVGAVASSSQIIFMKKFSPTSFLQTVQHYDVNKLFIVPQLAIFLAKHPIVDEYDLSSVKDVICGAAPVAQNILDMIETRLRILARQGYGLTEMNGGTVFMPCKVKKPNSCGLLCPNIKLKIVDVNTGKQLPANSVGEIYLKGPTVMKGYINNPDATRNSFDEEGYLRTGDIGYFDNEGFIYLLDRLKDMIKCKGYQVAPSELEDILLSHPGVKEAAVIGIPHERAGEVPLAFIVRQPNSNVSESELIDLVAERVSATKKLVGGVRFLEAIPRNPSGKILKRVLREFI